MSFHCIIHQESLCKSVLDLKHVIDPVVRQSQGAKSQAVQTFA